MFIQASKLIGLPIGELDSNSKIAEVKEIIINPKNGELIGLLAKQSGFFGKNKVLSSRDILDFDRHAVVTRSEDDLVEPAEIVRIKKLLDEDVNIIGMRARTESGEGLGKVSDFVFDSEGLIISKFYLHGMFNERIIPAKKVVKIDGDRHEIVFSDDILKPTKAKRAKNIAAEKAIA